PAGSDVFETATNTSLLSSSGLKPSPVKNQRPLGASYRIRGSLKAQPDGMGSFLLRSTIAVRVPDLVQMEPVLLIVSTRFVGPAAIIVSGGSRLWSLPNCATAASSLVIGKAPSWVSAGRTAPRSTEAAPATEALEAARPVLKKGLTACVPAPRLPAPNRFTEVAASEACCE